MRKERKYIRRASVFVTISGNVKLVNEHVGVVVADGPLPPAAALQVGVEGERILYSSCMTRVSLWPNSEVIE